MNRLFKTNSRFSALIDDIPSKNNKNDNNKINNEDKKIPIINSITSNNNSFKGAGIRERRYNKYPSERECQQLREEYEDNKKAKRAQEDRKKQESLTIDNFPELTLNIKETIVNQNRDYLEKLNKAEKVKDENKDIDTDLQNLNPGWILIKKDNLTSKTIMKCKEYTLRTPEISQEQTTININNVLSRLYKKRTEEYIEFNGFDTWEKMFKCPDWREMENQSDDETDSDDNSSVEEY